MNIMTFTYTKDADNITNRVFIPISKPTDKYFGIDITELDIEDQGTFTAKLEDLKDEYDQKVDDLLRDYDLNYRYRSFLPSKMTNIVTED